VEVRSRAAGRGDWTLPRMATAIVMANFIRTNAQP
jgi:hypothetical protein